MSENIHGLEKSSFKQKHGNWLGKTRIETGSILMGGIGGALGLTALATLGIVAPVLLLAGAAVGALAGYAFTKKTSKA